MEDLILVTKRRLDRTITALWAKIKTWVINQIQSSIQPPEKEVVNCRVVDYLVDNGFPATGVNGKTYADSDSGVIKKYINGEWEDKGEIESEDYYIGLAENRFCQYSDTGWQDIAGGPSASIIYVATTPDLTVKMYLWDHDNIEWKDVTGEKVDDIIYVDNITTALESYTERGYYTVCYTYQRPGVGAGTATVFYTFMVDRSSTFGRNHTSTTYVYQTLSNMEGYLSRYKRNQDAFTTWTNHTYSYEGHTHAISDVTNLQTRLDEIQDIAYAGL